MSAHSFERLRGRLQVPDSLLTELEALTDYHHDATTYNARPTALLLAESAADIIASVRFCADENIPITARGAGTGLSGGCVVSPGGLLLSTERLRQLDLMPDRKMAICGPGVITKELVDAAGAFDLTYPPDPASYEESTLGGNIAENAGGLRCKRFGVTKDYVLGLEAVLPDGSLLKTGWFNRNAGFSLGDLIVGSEGTLAIVTRIALRLIDQPGRGETMLVGFDRPEDGARTVTQINAAGIIPTVMEFLDGDAAACSNEYEESDEFDDIAALLLIETSDNDAAGQFRQIEAICRTNACSFLKSESDPERSEKLWQVRRNLSKAVKAAAGLRISEDVAVPNSQFPTLVRFVAEMNTQSQLRINSYGHAGDGNLHVNFMAPADSAEHRFEIDRLVEVLMRRTIELGGTLTGEHGIGLAKRDYLDLEFNPVGLKILRTIKSTFDPDALFNPDKLLPPVKKFDSKR